MHLVCEYFKFLINWGHSGLLDTIWHENSTAVELSEKKLTMRKRRKVDSKEEEIQLPVTRVRRKRFARFLVNIPKNKPKYIIIRISEANANGTIGNRVKLTTKHATYAVPNWIQAFHPGMRSNTTTSKSDIAWQSTIYSFVKCSGCTHDVCQTKRCSIWVPSPGTWNCKLCNSFMRGSQTACEWFMQKINHRLQRQCADSLGNEQQVDGKKAIPLAWNENSMLPYKLDGVRANCMLPVLC